MDNTDILQELSSEFSSFVKKNMKNIKSLDGKTQRELGNLINDFKSGLDDLS